MIGPELHLKFFVAGLPETKGSWRAIAVGKVKRDNPREKAWSTTVGWAARAKMIGQRPYDGHVAVAVDFILPPPVGKKNRRDIDKLVRSVLDAMNGIVYVDDELVTKVMAEKTVTRTGGGYGAMIEVRRADRVHYRALSIGESL